MRPLHIQRRRDSLAKRFGMQVHPKEMALFEECHKQIGAKSIDRSIAKTIRHLRQRIKELEAQSVKGTVHAYVEGAKDTVEVLTQTPQGGEPSTRTEAPQLPVAHPSQACRFYSEGETDGLVHCSKDYDRKGVIHRVTPTVCDQCWQLVQKDLQQQEVKVTAKS